MAINSIGVFVFLDIGGQPPDVVKMALRTKVRDGVNGTFVMQLGYRGKPFTCRTSVDAADLAAAMLLYNAYTLLIASDPVVLVWRGLDLSAGDQLYQVIDVRPVNIARIGGNSGGLNPPSLAICECEWDLLPVKVT